MTTNFEVNDFLKSLVTPEPGQSITGLIIGLPDSRKTLLQKKLHLVSSCTSAGAHVLEGEHFSKGAHMMSTIKTRPLLITVSHPLGIENVTDLALKTVIKAPDVAFWLEISTVRGVLSKGEDDSNSTVFSKFENSAFDYVLRTDQIPSAPGKCLVEVIKDRYEDHTGKTFSLDFNQVQESWKDLTSLYYPGAVVFGSDRSSDLEEPNNI